MLADQVMFDDLFPHRRDVVSYSDKELFFNSVLLLSEADVKILTESTVAMGGIWPHSGGNAHATFASQKRNGKNRDRARPGKTLGLMSERP